MKKHQRLNSFSKTQHTSREKQFSCKTAAEHYSFSQSYFRKLIFEKKISTHKIGKSIRFYQSDLDAYFESNYGESHV